jgi:hypothetical protein
MAKQNNIHETNGALLELYFVSGRVCDCEDEFKLVSATSASQTQTSLNSSSQSHTRPDTKYSSNNAPFVS